MGILKLLFGISGLWVRVHFLPDFSGPWAGWLISRINEGLLGGWEIEYFGVVTKRGDGQSAPLD
jgi:hypothetical protein